MIVVQNVNYKNNFYILIIKSNNQHVNCRTTTYLIEYTRDFNKKGRDQVNQQSKQLLLYMHTDLVKFQI